MMRFFFKNTTLYTFKELDPGNNWYLGELNVIHTNLSQELFKEANNIGYYIYSMYVNVFFDFLLLSYIFSLFQDPLIPRNLYAFVFSFPQHTVTVSHVLYVS